MPRVVPSQVVDFIDSIRNYEFQEMVSMNHVGSATLSALLDLLEQIPDELLTMDKETYGSFVRAKAQVNDALATWVANRNAGHNLQPFQFHRTQNPLMQIRNAFTNCPDESPAPGTSELSFITDADLRTNLRNDIGAVNRALSNGEWKAATVLAGSAAEALLLWALKQRTPAEISAAVTSGRASGNLATNPGQDLEWWNLHQYIEVSTELDVIKPNTATQARLAKNFRNFIHPGVAQRLGEKCDRATALSAVAGVEHIVRDLS